MMTSIALERIPRRLWKVFFVLAQRLGQDTSAGLRFPFPFSRQEVAEMIGATNETVTRAFGLLKKSKEISEDRSHITLLGLHELSQVEQLAD